MLSSFVRVHFFCLYLVCPKKHLLPFIRIQSAFVPNFFQKNLPSLLVAQLLRRLYEKNLVVEKKPLITDRDKNRSFDSLFSKNSEFFAVQNIPLFNPTLKAVFVTLLRKFFYSEGKIFYVQQ